MSSRKQRALLALSNTYKKDSVIINPPYITEYTSNFVKDNYTNINCYYATDRSVVYKNAHPIFGTGRSEIHYGNCNVSIPKEHQVGKIETTSILKLDFKENPDKHVAILNTYNLKKEDFHARIKNHNKISNSVFIFIHGYNLSFAVAAKRTAQIYNDFGFKGIPILYSWPSQDNILKYTVDEDNSEWSTNNFKIFLSEFLKNNDKDIYIIAHSMGNRLLIKGLTNLSKEVAFNSKKIKELILVAPDIDADIFERDYINDLIKVKIPMTLYVSSKDNALLASKIVHGNKRLGDSGKVPFLNKSIETIDASKVDTDVLGHSYFSDTKSVADDVFYLINNHLRADQRRLTEKKVKSGKYWQLDH